MYYLALLAAEEGGPASVPGTDEYAASMQRHQEFWTRAQEAVAGGGLYPGSEAATIRHDGGGNAVVTDGPSAEVTEVVGGYYVFDAADLDAALSMVRQIPEVSTGHVELWPMVFWNSQDEPMDSWWAALLREPSGAANEPGSAEWEARVTEHKRFGEIAGDRIKGSGALFPPASATTVRLRDGEMLLTDGPFTEADEIANGIYVLSAPDRDAAIALASQIPVGSKGCVELRQIVAG
ncbi:transcription initiation protein [Rhodococcus hoagii]|uniref:Transcription initiation protein n=1 Tax=Rhodococcus hoagii TaxID=43767 RepID=A0AAE2W6P8_RHOHA|nr:YciI family protein [Prescottella equi]MBM4492841.1 transcription initiation protein [Prescottella equi]MBM4540847.1 transcription initiation protein [Prescottella equi]MBM4714862.1 transcription initiation protein [Prescottella equi]NKS00487.1 transcription initiation protein [Prescottella equi]NKS11624.1 transcription initiation protein [Prescottella equi]